MTPREAVEFFATKIESQAKAENVQLTDVEKLMLRFSEVEPDGLNDKGLFEQFDRDYEMDTYEQKMGDLLLRAYETDKVVPAMWTKWDEAKVSLGEHDYSILAMIWKVYPENNPFPPTPPRKPSTIWDHLIYVVVAICIVGILLFRILSR